MLKGRFDEEKEPLDVRNRGFVVRSKSLESDNIIHKNSTFDYDEEWICIWENNGVENFLRVNGDWGVQQIPKIKALLRWEGNAWKKQSKIIHMKLLPAIPEPLIWEMQKELEPIMRFKRLGDKEYTRRIDHRIIMHKKKAK
ncbi:MAG: hypothetical protein Ta2E_11620 [Mycoplasmoidaceae bacterium]|nr:MAG: hypothetical protein Ta2E_11620 [Mycoplasmoidaceae bacterium]